MMFYVKFHSNPNGSLFAACDEELIGKTFNEDGRKIVISESFYKGDLVSEDELIERMKGMPMMNLMGENTINVAIKEGYIPEDGFIIVAGIKHAQAVR